MSLPSTPMETYLRLMFLKFRYRLGYESLCREGHRFDHLAAVLPDPAGWHGSASDNADETDHPLRRSCRFGMQRGPAREVRSVECQTVERIASSTNIRTCRKRRLRRRAAHCQRRSPEDALDTLRPSASLGSQVIGGAARHPSSAASNASTADYRPTDVLRRPDRVSIIANN